ncbi:MAG: hypothetical protein ACYDHE_17075 [Candidatus Acidiferrales bacterium]
MDDRFTLALLLTAALALMVAWELLEHDPPRTPIPDAVRKAFDDGSV